MKNLLTLFLITITALCFAQQPYSGKAPKMFSLLPGTTVHDFSAHKGGSSVQRSLDSCDDEDILDYSTYNELIATNVLSITYTGSWNSQTPQVAGEEINSSFITVNNADNGVFSYVVQAFDSLAFANFQTQAIYSKERSASTITIDTLAMFAGVAADDTTPTGGLAGDSIVLSIYPINGITVSSTPVQTITYSGYDGLAPFVVGTTPGYMREVILPVTQSLSPGQGFAIGFQFFSSDTSSHCWLSYSYADSCQTVTYQGQQYTSPAYPSPFINTAKYGNPAQGGSAFWGEIDSTAPTTAAVTNVSNQYGYFGAGFPVNCSYEYPQNWEILAQVSVQSAISISIADSVYAIPCNGNVGNAHPLTTTRSGDLAGATYAWSSNVFGSQTTANSTFFNPGIYTVTVTNSQGCTATAEENASFANGLNLPPPTFSTPSEICEKESVTFTNTSSNAGGYYWVFAPTGSTIIQPVASGAVNPTVTYDTTGSYTVVLTLDTEGCIFGSSEVITVENCTGVQSISAFANSVNIIPNPSNGNINITISDADKNVTITVYNIIGQVVRAYATTESPAVFNKNLDLSELTGGTYLAKIQSGNKIATKKLVITK